MTEQQTAYLTVPEAAERLGMTADGVYKLIQRGKLRVERISARKTKVPVAILEEYIEAQQAAVRQFRKDSLTASIDDLRTQFEEVAGMRPDDWLASWKRDEIADTPENMRLLVQAVALHGPEGLAPVNRPESDPWAPAALAALSA